MDVLPKGVTQVDNQPSRSIVNVDPRDPVFRERQNFLGPRTGVRGPRPGRSGHHPGTPVWPKETRPRRSFYKYSPSKPGHPILHSHVTVGPNKRVSKTYREYPIIVDLPPHLHDEYIREMIKVDPYYFYLPGIIQRGPPQESSSSSRRSKNESAWPDLAVEPDSQTDLRGRSQRRPFGS